MFSLLRRLPSAIARRAAWAARRIARVGSLEADPLAPDLFRAYRALTNHPEVERQPGGWSYRGQRYPDLLTVGGAGHAIFPVAARFCRGQGIDVGAGYWPLPGSIAIDPARGIGSTRSLDDVERASLDYVFSSHCLEHIAEWRSALAEWARKIKPGGVLFLYLPHPDCGIWQPGSPFVGDGHKWSPTPDVLRAAVGELGLEFVAGDDGPDGMWSFWLCARAAR